MSHANSTESVAPALIDSHCHLDMPAFDADRDAVVQRARDAGVIDGIVPAVEPLSWDRTVRVARAAGWHHAVGIHPQALPDLSRADVTDALARLESFARDSGAVAIGECGLDGGIDLATAPFEWQCEVLAAHVAIARRLSMPIVLHVLRAHAEAIAFLRTLPRDGARAGVVHSYSGSAELVPAYLDLGFSISFAGGISRPNARRPVAAARAVPIDRLLVETDAPDQIPSGATLPLAITSGVPRETARCEPAHVTANITAIARAVGLADAVVARHTTANARALFSLPAAPAAPATSDPAPHRSARRATEC